ncbi:MAG TPA: hypothetical protein VK753_03070 [Xanthomonadaceae bacterium]|nr:hypothetical protein [Xanthomonadaceae bacterium]
MRTRRQSLTHPALVLLCMSAFGALHAGDKLDQGVRFDSPQVLDLSAWSVKPEGSVVPVTTLAASDVEKIYDEPTSDEQPGWLRFSDDVYACKDSSACSRQHEHVLIATENGSVQRLGKHLRIVPTKGALVVFSDWKIPATRSADGDEESHWYLGRLAGNGYHRVEVQFGHDAPGNFLINPANGKTAFVHNGSDVVEGSPDGLHLVTFNAGNPPLSIRVAALDASGPRFELVCAAGKANDSVVPVFSGWNDAQSFDITLKIRGRNNRLEHREALRFMRAGTAWTVAESDRTQFDAIGFECRQGR